VKKEIRIGFILVLTLAALIWGLNFLKGKNFFSRTKSYVVIYDDVSGLLKSDGVYVKGYKVGNVQSLSFTDSTLRKLTVVLAIKNNILVPKNTIAQIYSLDLIGNKAVQLYFSNEKKYLAEGDSLQGDIEISVAKQIAPYKLQAYNLLKDLDSLSEAVLRVFNPVTSNSLKEIIKNLHTATSVIVNSSDNINSTFENIETVTRNLRENNKRISEILKNLKTASDTLSQVKLLTSINKLNQTLDETHYIVSSIKNGSGTLGKLLKSDTLYNNLNKTSVDLDSLINDLKGHPDKYIRFSVFGSKKK